MDDRSHWRRHKGACPFYRENWVISEDTVDEHGEAVLYEVYCLKDTPPVTIKEQDKCLRSPRACWRLRQRDAS